jgi:Fur family iron response transcriptional regulator
MGGKATHGTAARESQLVAKDLHLARPVAYDLTCNNRQAASAADGEMTQFRAKIVSSEVASPPGTGVSPAMRADLNGCPWHDVKAMLREVGLRPTRQRMSLGWILFSKGDRHITAEMLYEEATRAKVPVSLATVYNTLHQFTDVGLLRQVAVDGSKSYFDTNVSDHHHFFIEGQCPGNCRQDAERARGL